MTDEGLHEPKQPDFRRVSEAFPGPVQPAVTLLADLAAAVAPLLRGLAVAALKLGKVALYVAIWVSPVVLWAGSKWARWYIMSYVRKAERVLRWAGWALSLLPKSSGGGGGASGPPQ